MFDLESWRLILASSASGRWRWVIGFEEDGFVRVADALTDSGSAASTADLLTVPPQPAWPMPSERQLALRSTVDMDAERMGVIEGGRGPGPGGEIISILVAGLQ